MAIVCSKFSEISDLDFKPFPRRLTKNLEVLYSGKWMFARHMKTGSLFTDCKALTVRTLYPRHEWAWTKYLLEALLEFGVITQSVLDEHMADVQAVDRREEARGLLNHTAERFTDVGVPLTKSQIRRLKEIGDVQD